MMLFSFSVQLRNKYDDDDDDDVVPGGPWSFYLGHLKKSVM